MRHSYLTSLIFLIIAVAPRFSHACDFCMLGQGVNPYLTSTGRGVTLDSTYIESDALYNGAHKIDSQGKQEGWLVETLTAFDAITPELTLLLSVPYAIKTNVDHDDASGLNTGIMTRGLGDVSLTGRYTFYHDHTADKTLQGGLLAGVKFPTGTTSVVDSAGEPVDRHAQPGTGSYDTNIGLTTSFSSAKGYQLTGDIVYSFAGSGKWSGRSHRYGDSLNASLKGYYRLFKTEAGRPVFFFSGPLFEWMGRERGTQTDTGYDAGLVNQSTGGSVLFWDFGVHAVLSDTSTLTVSFAKAIDHDMNYSSGFDADPAENYKLDFNVSFLF